MFIIYFSNITRNTERFVEKMQPETSYRIPLKISNENLITVNTPYVLITPTYGDSERKGAVPKQVKKFLTHNNNYEKMVAVVSAGNRNFGAEYGIAGEIISKKFHIPHLHKFELSGEQEDVEKTKNMILLLTTADMEETFKEEKNK